MFGQTSTLDLHLKYTRNEWNTSGYYKKVTETLLKSKIKSYIDIGACSGGVADVLFDKIPSLSKSIMIDANKENTAFINQNNKNNPRVKVINSAIFYGRSELKLGICPHNVGGSSYNFNENQFKVKATTIENIIEENQKFIGDVDFIKIDIEGAEYNVLQNSSSLKSIPFIEIEFHRDPLYTKGAKRIFDFWNPFCQKHLPNHKLLHGGPNEEVVLGNGSKVYYSGSGLFALK